MNGNQEGNSEPVPTEEVTLNYTKIEWMYIQHDQNGRPVGETTTSWNFETGQPAIGIGIGIATE